MQRIKSIKPLQLAAVAILISVSSCRTTNIPYTRTQSDPYVQTKDGKKFAGTSAERSENVFKDKIVLGDTSFKSKDVAFYSTGGRTYANVGRKTFAEQVAAGKINLYKYEYTTVTTSSHGSSTSHHINYYIQKKEGEDVKFLKYKFLAPMVHSGTPEFKMLEKYRTTRIVSRSLGYGSLGLLAAGGALVASNNSGVGTALIGAGVGAFIGWAAVYVPNQMRLLKAVLIADKADKGHGKHSRSR